MEEQTPGKEELRRVIDGTGTDIDDRAQAERALRESETALRTLFDSVYDAVILHSRDGKIIDINKSALQMYGLTREEMLKMSIGDISGKSNRAATIRSIWATVMEGRDQFFVWKARRPRDDHEFDVEVFLTRLRIKGKDLIMANVRDITERMRSEEILRLSEERFRLIADSMPQLVWTAGPDGVVDYVNRVFEEYSGEAGISLLDWKRLIHPEDVERVAGAWENSRLEGTPFQAEYRVRRGDGVFRWHLGRGVPIRDREGHITKWYGTVTDIHDVVEAREKLQAAHDELEKAVKERTFELHQAYNRLIKETRDRKQAEEQLRHSQKMEALGTMAGGIAHDFNNILAAIVGFTELAMTGLPEGSPEHHHLDQVIRASLKARDLIKQMLLFGRSKGQKKTRVSISQIVEDSLPLLRASIPTTIDIEITISDRSGMILADSVHIQQILLNLASNAADAMRPGGGVLKIGVGRCSIRHVHKSGLKPGEYMILSVVDTGRGIPGENLERVFDPFFTTKPPGKGTGLGLSVVHGIVKSYDGIVTIRSRSGIGSTFRVYLPKAGEAEPSSRRPPEPAPGGHERILYVDDEAMIAEIAAKMVADLGYDVTVATSSVEALDAFRTDPGRFDLVITDEIMPGMTGTELAAKILSLRGDIPIIISTGYHAPRSSEGEKPSGVTAFVMKPMTKTELARTIRQVLDRKRAV